VVACLTGDLVVDFFLCSEGNIEVYQSKMAMILVGQARTAINFVALAAFWHLGER
jgi:hypothetical protein